MENSEHASIDIGSLAASLRENIKTVRPIFEEECCIYRVPQSIRSLSEIAFTPQIVSIGPLHYNKLELKVMEEHKIRYLNNFLRRTQVSIEDFLTFIEGKEDRLRNCYAEKIDLKRDVFVRMILVDAVFLIEYFLRCTNIDDCVLGRPWIDIEPDMWLLENQLPLFILKDLFIRAGYDKLYKGLNLFKLIRDRFKGSTHLARLNNSEETYSTKAKHLLDLRRLCLEPLPQKEPDQPAGPKHLLDLRRLCLEPRALSPSKKGTEPEPLAKLKLLKTAAPKLLMTAAPEPESPKSLSQIVTEPESPESLSQNVAEPESPESLSQHVAESDPPTWLSQSVAESESMAEPEPRESPSQNKERDPENIPTVTELHQAGVKFTSDESQDNLLDITFSGRILTIPLLKIYQSSEVIYRNLLAFESMHSETHYINDYVLMMSHLLSTAKDVELLVQKGIIKNWMVDNEAVSTLFHNLGEQTGLYEDVFKYSALVQQLKRHCDSLWHKWMAILKQNYFNTPWASISVVAAVILLLFTIIQTVCSIISL